jgi:hypothetical protein
MAGQQLTFQQSHGNDLSRTVALFEQTSPGRAPAIATPGWPERLLGCTLREYVGTAILLYAVALKNQGRFDLDWLGGRPSKPKSGSELFSGSLVAEDTLDDGGVFC